VARALLEVADFTYVPLVSEFGYTAFMIDAYARLIPGWECSLTKDTAFIERALRHAAAFRARQGHPFDGAIHHSDAGSQIYRNTFHRGTDAGRADAVDRRRRGRLGQGLGFIVHLLWWVR
jgi:transposase InsO family protein